MVEKISVDSSVATLLHPRNTVLVSCAGKDGKADIITVAWCMPTSGKPPLVAISVSPKRHSHKLIQESGEFAVNVPTMEIVRETLICGRISGRTVDKFQRTKLTAIPAQKVKAPLIEEYIAHLECRVIQQVETGDHTVFVGEVLAASANKGVFADAYDIDKFKPVLHVGDDKFVTLNPEFVIPKI